MSELVPPPAVAERPPDEDEQLWREGCRVGMPTLFGLAAWGLVVGIAMVKSGLTVPQALGMTLLVFSGTAQLAALPLIAADAPVWVVFATAVVINLRFVIFSALLAPHFAHLPWPKRMALGYTTGDLTVALFLKRFPSEAPALGKLSYLKGLLYPNWGAWQVGTLAGIFLGSAVPEQWGLGFAGTLAIICILVPLTIGRASWVGVAVAAVTSVLAHGLPYKLGLLAAVLAGMVSAMVVKEWLEKPGSKGGQRD
ncbi:MAG: AzlC family ABC transporter permease [Gammaproteobacteria bacterium]